MHIQEAKTILFSNKNIVTLNKLRYSKATAFNLLIFNAKSFIFIKSIRTWNLRFIDQLNSRIHLSRSLYQY